jgi:hypothetical protein
MTTLATPAIHAGFYFPGEKYLGRPKLHTCPLKLISHWLTLHNKIY